MSGTSEVGHGRFGMRSNLKTFEELTALSNSRKDALVEIEGGMLANTGAWSVSGGGYRQSFTETLFGVALVVIGVRTLSETLTQVNTAAACQATAGTFYHAQDQSFVYVHLTGGTDPSTLEVLFVTKFGFSTAAGQADHLLHPILGPEMLTDGELDVWSSATDLTNHTEDLSGAGWTVNRESTTLFSGSFAARLSSTGAAAGSAAFRQTPTMTSGNMFRLCGYYNTPITTPSSQHTYVRIGTTVSLSSDGRTADTTLSTGAELDRTVGHWRFFCYDFISHETDPRIAFRSVDATLVASDVYFDKLSLKQINGWLWYNPRVAADGIPEFTMGSADVYPGSEEVGAGQIKLLNDGKATLEKTFSPPWFFMSRAIRVLAGGAFPGGQEILYNDMEPAFAGVVAGGRSVEVNDKWAIIQAEDQRSILKTILPTRRYGTTVESRDIGRPRPLVFGVGNHIRMARTSADGSTLYGIYETCDTTDWPTGIGGVGGAASGFLYAYPDEEAADKNDPQRRVALSDTLGDYSQSITAGTLSITHDVRVMEINRGNSAIDFVLSTLGAGIITAQVTAGPYIIGNGDASVATFRRGLLEALRQAMNTAAGIAAFSLTYSESTHKVTIQWTGKGTLTLVWKTGPNNHATIGGLLGFDLTADSAAATTITANDAIFTNPDSTHIIRADMAGFADDGSGTYTGTPGNTLQRGCDILRFILKVILGLPDSRIDLPSFVAARATNPEVNYAYLGGLASITGDAFDMTVQDVIDRLEAGNFCDVIMDGSGKFFYNPRTSTVPATAPQIYDRDYLEFTGYLPADDVFGTVRVLYNQDASTGVVRVSEVTNNQTVLRDNRPQARDFPTFLVSSANADTARDHLAAVGRAAIRHFEFACKGKLLRAKVGDLIRLTRDQALQSTAGVGTLSADAFRIMYLSKDFLRHRVRALVHTQIIS